MNYSPINVLSQATQPDSSSGSSQTAMIVAIVSLTPIVVEMLKNWTATIPWIKNNVPMWLWLVTVTPLLTVFAHIFRFLDGDVIDLIRQCFIYTLASSGIYNIPSSMKTKDDIEKDKRP